MKCTCGAKAVNGMCSSWCDSHAYEPYPVSQHDDDGEDMQPFIFPPMTLPYNWMTGAIGSTYKIKSTAPTPSGYILTTCVACVDEKTVDDMQKIFTGVTTVINGKKHIDFGMIVLEET
jgi:hypothetical protein